MDHAGRMPVGVALWETTQLVTRTFDDVLAEHGGNRSVWFVLLALDASLGAGQPTQRELARAVGITEATLTYHLDALERRGLVVRRRDDRDRRAQRVAFTPAGREAFVAMRDAAVALDDRLRAALGADGTTSLLAGLSALARAVAAPGEAVPPPVS